MAELIDQVLKVEEPKVTVDEGVRAHLNRVRRCLLILFDLLKLLSP